MKTVNKTKAMWRKMFNESASFSEHTGIRPGGTLKWKTADELATSKIAGKNSIRSLAVDSVKRGYLDSVTLLLSHEGHKEPLTFYKVL